MWVMLVSSYVVYIGIIPLLMHIEEFWHVVYMAFQGYIFVAGTCMVKHGK